ncbi:MAG TPA: mannose-1-phosphate guanylyltransferase, partial [Proteobacteria bacterium]|nr:mannose-1-phosphate guanylyltransferase [Pseudomonadota bacterium]
PKQLLKLGAKSLLRLTYERIAPIVEPERVFVFTSRRIADAVRAELPEVPATNIVPEPAPRNTAPCIAVCAQLVWNREPDGIIAVFPADHHIAEAGRLRRIVLAAARFASESDALVTLGIKPRYPETGYGYLEFGEPAGKSGGMTIYKLSRFLEKPPLAKAKRFVRSGKHYWNSGIFVWRADTILGEIARFLPKTFELSKRIAQASNFERALARSFVKMESTSIDYGVMEGSDKVYSIPVDITWSDLGSWASLYELLRKDRDGNAVEAGDLVSVDSSGLLVHAQNKLVAAIGISDLAIIATDKAILVCPRGEAQRVRDVVSILEKKGKEDLL